MAFGLRLPRGGVKVAIARKDALWAHYVPTTKDTAKLPDISGNNRHCVPYPTQPALSDQPPFMTGQGTQYADTPILAATMPPAMTFHFFAKVRPLADNSNVLSTIPGVAIQVRLLAGDVLMWVYCSDGTVAQMRPANQNLVAGSVHDLCLVASPGLVVFYLDGERVASANKTIRPEPNNKIRFIYSGTQSIGASLIYLGTALNDNEVAQNRAYLRAVYGY